MCVVCLWALQNGQRCLYMLSKKRIRTFSRTAALDLMMLHRAYALRKRKRIHFQVHQTWVPCPSLRNPMRTYASAITTCRKAVFERNSVPSGPYHRSYEIETAKHTALWLFVGVLQYLSCIFDPRLFGRRSLELWCWKLQFKFSFTNVNENFNWCIVG